MPLVGDLLQFRDGVRRRIALRSGALTSAESVADLIHIDPETIERDLLKEKTDFVLPVGGGVRVPKVRKTGGTGPHTALKRVSVLILNVGAGADETVVGRVLTRGANANAGIDDHNVLLSVLVQLVGETLHLGDRVVDRVKGKVEVLIHVVDVTPDGVQRDAGRAVVGHHLLDVADVRVAVLALMEAERPVGREARQADQLLVLLYHVGGRRTGEEVKVEQTADHAVGDATRLQHHVHTVAVHEQYAVHGAIAHLHVEGMRAVQVLVRCRRRGVTVPQCIGVEVGVQLEAGAHGALAQAVHGGVLRHGRGDLQELVLEDQTVEETARRGRGVEEHTVIRETLHRKAERVLRVAEGVGRRAGSSGRVRVREHLGGHLPSLQSRIAHSNAHSIVGLHPHIQTKSGQIGAEQVGRASVQQLKHTAETTGGFGHRAHRVSLHLRLCIETPRKVVRVRRHFGPTAADLLALGLVHADETTVVAKLERRTCDSSWLRITTIVTPRNLLGVRVDDIPTTALIETLIL
mmetsp:Transcript_34929/g.87900  ORF Transcript_34929/g.87900 Transcript_34929/m.87900 type:complete len:520 (+) Transcript_34929:1346-2905(+)